MSKRIHGWTVVRGSVTKELAAALADLPAAIASPSAVRFREGNTRVTALLPQSGAVWKLCRRVGSRARWQALWGRSDVCREFDLAARAFAGGIATPRPLFAGEQVTLGILRRAVVVFEYVPDSVSLDRLIDCRRRAGRGAPDGGERLKLLRRCGALLASVHHAGACHNDLHLHNVLVRGRGDSADLMLLDWPKASFGRTSYGAEQKLDLVRAVVNLVGLGASFDEIDALFSAYCDKLGWPAHQRRTARRWLIGEAHRRLKRFVERTRRRALSKTRRLQRRRSRGHTVVCLQEADGDRVAAALLSRSHQQSTCTAVDGSDDMVVVRDAGAVTTWRAACVCENLRLPCRKVIGISVRRNEEAGWLAMEPAKGVPISNELRNPSLQDAALRDLRSLARLLHCYGLRLRACTEGDVRRVGLQDPLAGRAGGLMVQNPSVLQVAPERDAAASWDLLAGHVASVAGQRAASALAPQARSRRSPG